MNKEKVLKLEKDINKKLQKINNELNAMGYGKWWRFNRKKTQKKRDKLFNKYLNLKLKRKKEVYDVLYGKEGGWV